MDEDQKCEAWGCENLTDGEHLFCPECWAELPANLRIHAEKSSGNTVHSAEQTSIEEFCANAGVVFWLAAHAGQLDDDDIPILADHFLRIARYAERKNS